MNDVVLKSEADGMGYLYGHMVKGEHTVRVDVLPPLSEVEHWRKPFVTPPDKSGLKPDPTLWIVHADGEEVGRVKTKADIGSVL